MGPRPRPPHPAAERSGAAADVLELLQLLVLLGLLVSLEVAGVTGVTGLTGVTGVTGVTEVVASVTGYWRTMIPGLPLLLLVLALQGGTGTPSGSPPGPPCGAATLVAILGRLRELEGQVRALQGQCGDSRGPQAGTALGCSDQGRCRGGRCHCFPGFTGPFCATPACPPGRGGPHCHLEIPLVTPRLATRNQTSFRVTWPRPAVTVDGYQVVLIPLDEPAAVTTHELPSTAVTFEVTRLSPGHTFELFIQAKREQHLGAPGTLRVRTLLAQTLPTHGRSPGSSHGSLGSPASPVAQASPSTRGSPASPRSPVSPASPRSPVSPASPGSPGSPGSPASPVSPDASLGSPGSLGSPAAPRFPVSPISRGSPGSPASPRSSVSPESSASSGSLGSPVSPRSPEAPASPVSPRSPTSPGSSASPQSPVSLPSPWSPVSPASPLSPVLSGGPSLRDLGAKLSSYNGSLLQRLESHLRATNFPLRGNQTVPAVARAILSYLLRRSPAPLRHQLLRQIPHPKPQLMPGAAGEALVDLDALRGHAETVVIRYQLLEEPEGTEGELQVPGDTAVARVPGLVPGAMYRVEVHGVVRGHISKSYTFLVMAGVGGTDEPPLEWEHMDGMELTEPQGAVAKTVPAPPLEEPRPRLGGLTVSHVTPDSVQLEWSVPEGTFDSFTVQYKDGEGQPQVVPVDGGSRKVTVPGLSPSRRYKFNLYGVWGRKRLGPVSTDAVTAAVKPEEESPSQPILGELRASQVTPDSVQLEWSVPEGTFDSFTVQYRDGEGQPQVVPVDGGSRKVTVPGLSPSRRYKFNLYGVWGRKRLGPVSTDAITVKPEEEPPSQPMLGELRASQVTPDSVQLEWSVPEGTFDSFTVQYRDGEGQPQVVPVDGGSRRVTVPGLSPSRRYKFNLYGVWGRKRLGPISTDAVTAAVKPEEEPPSQPILGELRASQVTPDSVQLEWSVPEGTFDSFTVQYKDGEGQPQVVPVEGGSRKVTVPGLSPSRRYKFNLYGVWGRKRLGPISTDAVTVKPEEEPPSQPILGELRASQVTPDSVQLEWSVPEGTFDSFTVQYRDGEGQPQVVPVDGGSRRVTVPGLSPSRRYKFNLYGVWGRKRLGPVSTDAITAAVKPEEEPPSQPILGELRASQVTPDSVQLEWSVPEGTFDSFTVQYKDGEGQPQVVPVDGGSRKVTVPGLSPSRRYKFNLYGVWGRKRLGPVSTDAVTVKPEEESPSQPILGELRASQVTPDSVQLEWSVPEGTFDSFTVQYRDGEGQPQVVPVDGGSRKVTVPGLSPSRRYKFNLYGVWGRKRLGPVSTDAITAAVKPEEEPPSQPILGELRASQVTPDSVQLEWSVPEGTFDSFTVQYRDGEGQPQVVPVDGGSRRVTVPGLSPSRRYKFNLYGVWGRKRLGPVSTDAITAAVKPEEESPSQPILGELRASQVTPDSVQLEWSVPEGTFDSFTVQYKDGEGQPQVVPVEGGSRKVTVPGLSPSRRYKFNLYGVWGRKRLGPVSTDAVTVKPEEESPSQPILGELRASQVTPDSVQLEWSVPEGTFDSFTVQYRDGEGQPQVVPVDGGSRKVTVPGLSPSRRYKFNLYGVWGRKRLGPVSTDAITAAVKPEEEPPSQPILGELRASQVTPDSVQLEWSVPEGTFDSFTVQYRDGEGQPQVVPMDGGSRRVTVPGLSPSRRYKFNLYGVWGRKRLGPVSTDAITVKPEEEPPSQPILGELRASQVTPDSVQLEWSVPEGTFDSFTVQYKDGEGQPQVVPVDGGSRKVTVPGLSPSRRYKFNLYGVWGRKRLGPVSTDAVTVKPEEESPSQPILGELRASQVTPDSVQLEWSVPEGTFDSFTVQYRDGEGQPQVVPVDGGSRKVTVPGLSPSRHYKFNLYGVWGRKRLGPVSTDAITAAVKPEESPSQPILGELRASQVTPDSVQLEWSVPEGTFDSFTVQYKDGEGQPQVVPVDGGSRKVTVPGLSPSRRYKFNLYGVWGRKRLGPVSTDVVTASAPEEENPPSLPRLGELTASQVTSNSVQLEWTVPEGTFDSFTVQYRDGQGQPESLLVDGGSNTVTISGLSPSQRYNFYLYGVLRQKRVGPIFLDTITAPAPQKEKPPSPPRLGELTASQVTPDSVQLEWSVSEGTFDSFTVQYRDGEGQPQVVPVDGGSRSVTVPGLSPSRRYKFNLYGVWGRKRLGPISTDAVTGAPGTLWVGTAWPRSARLHWAPLHIPPEGYDLIYGPPGGPQQTLRLPPEATSHQLWGLEPAGHYGVQLWGRRGDSPPSPLETTFDTREAECLGPWVGVRPRTPGSPHTLCPSPLPAPLPHPHPRDCAEEQLNGPGPSRETLIFLGGDPGRPLHVFCDMETNGGGWLVFQRRQDGGTDFWRGWDAYAHGFGNVTGEFWLGNEALHALTLGTPTELRVDLRTPWDSAFAHYRDFAVAGPEDHYRLHLGAYSGTAGDALSYHAGSPFSTRDRDPRGRPRPCAIAYAGAWWYHNCHYANLNGRYGTPRHHQGINWFPWKGFDFSIPFTEMKLRPQRD
ncbi:tenascin-X [Podargus strigoides]